MSCDQLLNANSRMAASHKDVVGRKDLRIIEDKTTTKKDLNSLSTGIASSARPPQAKILNSSNKPK